MPHNIGQAELQRNVDTRTLRVGNLTMIRLGSDGVKVDLGSGDEMQACILPVAILSAVRDMCYMDRMRLLRWFGCEYTPRLFSDRLDQACAAGGKHSGLSLRIARALGVSAMAVSHWRRKHSLPTEDQVRRIAELLQWDVFEALADLRYEVGEKANIAREKMAAAGRGRARKMRTDASR